MENFRICLNSIVAMEHMQQLIKCYLTALEEVVISPPNFGVQSILLTNKCSFLARQINFVILGYFTFNEKFIPIEIILITPHRCKYRTVNLLKLWLALNSDSWKTWEAKFYLVSINKTEIRKFKNWTYLLFKLKH